jgi:hypothetical protein
VRIRRELLEEKEREGKGRAGTEAEDLDGSLSTFTGQT